MDKDKLKIVQYLPEDFIKIVGSDEASVAHARLNRVAGPAYSAYLNGKLAACGGIRVHGIGEGWVTFTPKALEDKKLLLRKCRELFDKMMREKFLWRIYAETKSEDESLKTFLEHMGFEQKTLFLR